MPQLRTFSAYTKNANAGVSLIARQCTLSNIDGNYITGAAGQYFQLHDKATAPVNTNVPVKSFLLSSAGPINLMSIFQVLGPISFTNGLAVAISSTEATLTLGVGSFDVFGEIEEYELPITGLSTITDAGTRVGCDVWANNASPTKHLYKITIINNEGVTIYPMIFGLTGPSDGAIPLVQLFPSIATGATQEYSFGSGGRDLRQISGSSVLTGCNVTLSTTVATLLTSTTQAATTSITVLYKNG